MDTFIRLVCPNPDCGKELKAPLKFAGKLVKCTRSSCQTQFRVPAPISPTVVKPDRKPQPQPERNASSAPVKPSLLPKILAWTVLPLLAIGLIIGGIWWIRQPSSDEVESVREYIRSGNELYEAHQSIKTDADFASQNARLTEMAQLGVKARNRIENMTDRKRKLLDHKFSKELVEMSKRLHGLIKDYYENKYPAVVVIAPPEGYRALYEMRLMFLQPFPDEKDRELWQVLQMDSNSPYARRDNKAQTGNTNSGESEPKKYDLNELRRKIAGRWENGGMSFTIEPDGTGVLYHLMTDGVTYGEYVGRFTIEQKKGVPTIAYTLNNGKSPFEFVIQPDATESKMVLKEVENRVTPNPREFTRPQDKKPEADIRQEVSLSEGKKFEMKDANWVRFSPDGKTVTAVSYNLALSEWDIASGKQLRTKPASDKHKLIAISHDFRQALTMLRPNEKTLGDLHIWDIEAGKSLRSWPEPPGKWDIYGPSAAFSPDGLNIAVLYKEPTIKMTPGGQIIIGDEIKTEVHLWNTETGKGITPFPVKSDFALGYSTDGKRIITSDTKDNVLTWNSRTGASEIKLSGAKGAPLSVTTTPDDKYFAASCLKDHIDTLVLWDTVTGKLHRTLESSKYYARYAISPDSKVAIVACCGEAGKKIASEIKLFDIATGKKLASKDGEADVWYYKAVFAPDGKSVALTGDSAGKSFVQLWKVVK